MEMEMKTLIYNTAAGLFIRMHAVNPLEHANTGIVDSAGGYLHKGVSADRVLTCFR